MRTEIPVLVSQRAAERDSNWNGEEHKEGRDCL
jgi:hypothetical protein